MVRVVTYQLFFGLFSGGIATSSNQSLLNLNGSTPPKEQLGSTPTTEEKDVKSWGGINVAHLLQVRILYITSSSDDSK